MPRENLEKIEKGIFFHPHKKQYIARVRHGRDFEKVFSRKSDARNWRNTLIADFRIAPPEIQYSVTKDWHFSLENQGETISKSFGDLGDAVRSYHELQHQIRTGSYVSEERRAVRFEDFAKSWLDGKVNLEESTRLRYDCELRNNVFPFLADEPVYKISSESVQKFVRQLMEAGKTPQTVHKAVGIVVQVMKGARKLKVGSAIEADDITLPKLTRKKSKAFSFDFVDELANLCGDYGSLIRLYVALGLRAEEMAALKVHHVRFDEAVLSIESSFKVDAGYKRVLGTTKSNQIRLLPLTPAAIEVLKGVVAGKDQDEFLWTGVRGGALNLNWFRRRVLRPALTQLGETESSLHAMRATFSSHLFSMKVSPAVITKLVGHSKLDTTLNHYTHVVNEDDLRAMTEFDSLLVSKTGQERGEMVNAPSSPVPQKGHLARNPRRRGGTARVAPRRIELPTHGLGNRCSIH